jgi:nitrite reductase/ring-hydroxylating ferredoxin subunit
MMILGTWGLASIGMITAGIFLLFFPGDPTTASSGGFGAVAPWFLLFGGFISLGLTMMTVSPLLGLDPPIPLRAKKIIPHSRMKTWVRAGSLDEFPEGRPKEVRLRTVRVAVVRMGERAYALGALCTHQRLPLAGIPLSPVKPEPLREDCVTCPFHGARFDIDTGRVVRQPWSSQWNNDHPLLGRVLSRLVPWPREAEDIQTFPVNVEGGDIFVQVPR